MRKSKFSETQIVAILKDAESGIPVADLRLVCPSRGGEWFRDRASTRDAPVPGVLALPEDCAG